MNQVTVELNALYIQTSRDYICFFNKFDILPEYCLFYYYSYLTTFMLAVHLHKDKTESKLLTY